MTVQDIKEYARKEMRDIRTGIKDMFKEEHYNALIYKILDMLDQLDEPTLKDITKDMRPATKEELEGINEYIKEISVTGE